MMKTISIYGAKSIALGAYRAISLLYPAYSVKNFIVTDKKGNPDTLAGLPVVALSDFADRETQIIVATPENLHPEISKYLDENGFHHYICLDSRKETALMERYYSRLGIFPSLHSLPLGGYKADVNVYMAKFYKDRPLQNACNIPGWITPIQVGAGLTTERICDVLDCGGDNISHKNVNYSELTALYYIWKNELKKYCDGDYIGLFHYRRFFDVSEDDFYRISGNDIDIILPLPTVHEPDIKEHYSRYISESDWQAALKAVQELQPDYMASYNKIFCQEYMYNYNMLLAKKEVLEKYCAWLFPILERAEDFSVPKGRERADRYIGYIGENLLTLYFMHNRDKFKIVHTGRIMLT